jgi:hypothetical protein
MKSLMELLDRYDNWLKEKQRERIEGYVPTRRKRVLNILGWSFFYCVIGIPLLKTNLLWFIFATLFYLSTIYYSITAKRFFSD